MKKRHFDQGIKSECLFIKYTIFKLDICYYSYYTKKPYFEQRQCLTYLDEKLLHERECALNPSKVNKLSA